MSSQTGSSAMILVVDDNAANLYATSHILRQGGYTVIEAASGKAGLRLAHAMPQPELIILDVRLPDLDGFEVCRLLKTDPVTATIPVILLTAERVDEEYRIAGLECGALAYLVQPVSSRELLAQVRSLLRVSWIERDLRESEERLHQALEAGQVFTFEWNPETDIVLRSPNSGRILGCTSDATHDCGAAFFERIHPSDRNAFINLVTSLSPFRPEYETQYRYLRPDGQETVLEEMGRADFDQDGKMIRLRGLTRDITLRAQTEKALRESEEQLRLFIEHAPAALAMFDKQMRYVNVSRRWLRDYSLEGCDLRGLSHYEVFPEIPDRWKEIHRRALAGEVVRADGDPFERANGSVQWLRWEVRPWHDADDQVAGIIMFTEDLTAMKQTEEALRQANERLVEADQRKDEFLAMLAHELRNPLAPVRNAIQILHLVGPANQVLQRQRAIIDRQVSHMARLLDDLLDVSRVTRGKITLQRQRLHLNAVLLHAIETARPLIDACHHTLEFNPPPDDLCVEGDIDRLAQVVGNLLTNAAKYTEEGGRIWLRAWPQEGLAIVEVRDNGLGIAPEILPRVFDLFAQAENSLNRSQGGLGIGLTMVKRLTELHGGSVDAYSGGPGQGAIFVVRLPALPFEEHVVPPPAKVSVQERSGRVTLRILVVDDVVDSAQSLAELLELWGHQVRTALNGAAALQSAREFKPELVLLDIAMPGMNGYETARRLRQLPEIAGAQLVAMTGYGQPQDHEATRAAGFDSHLVKPVNLDQLRQLLEALPA